MSQTGESVEVSKRISKAALTEVSIGSERVDEWFDLLVEMFLLGKVAHIFNASLVLLLHYGSGSLSENSQFFNYTHIHFQSGPSLKGIASPIVITNFYLQF